MRLGILLFQENVINEEQLKEALSYQKENPKARIGETLINLGYTDIKTICGTLTKQQPKDDPFLPRLGETLILEDIITQKQLQEALEYQKQNPGSMLGQALINLGFANRDTISNAFRKIR